MPIKSNEPAKAQRSRTTFLRWFIGSLIFVLCLWLAFVLTGEVLCEIALDQIAELTDTKITTESVDFDTNGSVLIRNLVIRPEQQKEYDDTILKAETVYARFGIGSLLLLHPRLKKISIKDFLFDAQHNLDTGRWNISAFRIKPSKDAVGEMPTIRLKRGMLRYSKVSNGQVITVAAVPIDAGFGPARKARGSYSFDITTAGRAGYGKSVLAGFWEPGRVKITGGISSADTPVFERVWTVDALNAELSYNHKNDYSLKLGIAGLHSSYSSVVDIFDEGPVSQKDDETGTPADKPGLFAVLQKLFNRYRPSGTLALDLEVFGSLERLSESRLLGKVHCRDVTICDRKFPYTIKHLTGRIDLTERSAVLNNLQGRHGDTRINFNGWSRNFGSNRGYQIQITSDNMVLDDGLYNALNAKLKKLWSAFSPSGLVAIDYRLSRNSKIGKKRALVVELLGAEAVYHRFPYPLKNLSGELLFSDGSITVSNVTSQVNDREITLNGKVTACNTARPVYGLIIEANDIPLNSTLASSLSDNQKVLYNKLNMTGLADADIKIFTPEGDSEPTNFIADVYLKKTSLSCGLFTEREDNLPLFISDISAEVVITPGLIRIEDFTGRCNQALISLTGRIRPGDQGRQSRYWLLAHAEGVQLNDDLISLMPGSLKKIVSELQPKGKINLTADLNKTGSSDRPEYKITVHCPGNSIGFEPFPYPVKDIRGSLTITKNSVILEDITASANDVPMVSDASTIKINGRIDLAEGAFSSDRPKLSAGNISLAANNFRIKGKSLTGLIVDACYFPQWQSWITESLIADFYGGRLAGKFELKQSEEYVLEYLLEAGFENVDLERFLSDTNREEVPRNNHTSGKMNGSLSIAGRVGESLPHIGRCRLKITDMQVGEISPLAKLLYVLNLTEPKDFAFRQMLIDSYIKQDRLFLKQFDLSGEAVAFNGSGWIDLKNQNVDLVLFARGRRIVTAEPSILQSLTEGLGQAVVRMEVTGNVYDLRVKTKTLPVIKEAVEILGTPRR